MPSFQTPTAASVVAAATLSRIDDSGSDLYALPRKIAEQADLTPDEKARLEQFFATPADDTADYATALRLYGGSAMRQALDDHTEIVTPETRIVAVLADSVQPLIGAASIPLVTVGPSPLVPSGQLAALTDTAAKTAETWHQVSASARWAVNDTVVWESADLHALRTHLANTVGCPGTSPWQPETVTASASPALGFSADITALAVSHNGATVSTHTLTAPKPVKARPASPIGHAIGKTAASMEWELARIVEAIVNVGWTSAQSRVRHIVNSKHKTTIDQLTNTQFDALNFDDLLKPSYRSVETQTVVVVERYLERLQRAVQGHVGATGQLPAPDIGKPLETLRKGYYAGLSKRRPAKVATPLVTRRFIEAIAPTDGTLPAGLVTAAFDTAAAILDQPETYTPTVRTMPTAPTFSLETGMLHTTRRCDHTDKPAPYGGCGCGWSV